MRLLSFRRPEDGTSAIGVRVGRRVLDVAAAARIAAIAPLPAGLRQLLAAGPNALARARDLVAAAQEHDSSRFDPAWRDETVLAHLPPIADADKFLCVGKNY